MGGTGQPFGYQNDSINLVNRLLDRKVIQSSAKGPFGLSGIDFAGKGNYHP
jgi:hypothetical protein